MKPIIVMNRMNDDYFIISEGGGDVASLREYNINI